MGFKICDQRQADAFEVAFPGDISHKSDWFGPCLSISVKIDDVIEVARPRPFR